MTNRNPIKLEELQKLDTPDGTENYVLQIECPVLCNKTDSRVVSLTHYCTSVRFTVHENTLGELENFAHELLAKVDKARKGVMPGCTGALKS